MKVLIRIQEVYKNLTKKSLQNSWADAQTLSSPISSPTNENDFEKRISMIFIISYLALILNFTIAIFTIYFLIKWFLSKWILYQQSLYRDSVNDHRKMKKCFRTGNKTLVIDQWSKMICYESSSSISFINLICPLMYVPDEKNLLKFNISLMGLIMPAYNIRFQTFSKLRLRWKVHWLYNDIISVSFLYSHESKPNLYIGIFENETVTPTYLYQNLLSFIKMTDFLPNSPMLPI